VTTTDPEIARLAGAGSARIERVEHKGRVLWIKRPEQLSLRMRLQKGDPDAAFAEECTAHQALFERGLPVAPVVAAGPEFLVTEDCGRPLRAIAWQDPPEVFHPALAAAATALASLHAAGVSHGRPSLKDICWQEGRIAFLDLERAGRDRALDRAQAMDVLILIFSTAVETGGSETAMQVAKDAYLAAGERAVWDHAAKRARWWAALRLPLWPVARLLRGNREFDAIGPFFRFFAG